MVFVSSIARDFSNTNIGTYNIHVYVNVNIYITYYTRFKTSKTDLTPTATVFTIDRSKAVFVVLFVLCVACLLAAGLFVLFVVYGILSKFVTTSLEQRELFALLFFDLWLVYCLS